MLKSIFGIFGHNDWKLRKILKINFGPLFCGSECGYYGLHQKVGVSDSERTKKLLGSFIAWKPFNFLVAAEKALSSTVKTYFINCCQQLGGLIHL